MLSVIVADRKIEYPAKFFANVPVSAISLLDMMLQFDSAYRISAREILRHPWLLDISNNSNLMGSRQHSMGSMEPLQPTVLRMMRAYNAECKLRQTILAVWIAVRWARLVQRPADYVAIVAAATATATATATTTSTTVAASDEDPWQQQQQQQKQKHLHHHHHHQQPPVQQDINPVPASLAERVRSYLQRGGEGAVLRSATAPNPVPLAEKSRSQQSLRGSDSVQDMLQGSNGGGGYGGNSGAGAGYGVATLTSISKQGSLGSMGLSSSLMVSIAKARASVCVCGCPTFIPTPCF